MTYKFSKVGAIAATRVLLFFGMLLWGSGAFAQLDSISVSISFTEQLSLDSLEQNDSIDVLNVALYADDIDFLGEVIATVYDLNSGHALAKIKSTKAELLSLSAISGSTATIEFPGFPPIIGSYRIDVLVRNFQGGNLPLLSTTY